MRKLFLLLIVLLCLSGCAETAVIFPDYTDEAIHCRFSLSVDGEPDQIELSRSPLGDTTDAFAEFTDATVTVCAPEALAGLTVRFSDRETYLISGETEIPAKRQDLGGFLMLLNCFSGKNEEVVNVQTVSGNSTQTAVTYETAYGTFAVVYTETLIPVSAEFTYRGHRYLLTDLIFFTP